MMSEAKEFPPKKLRAIVSEVAALLKEKKESVSVAETVCCISILSTTDSNFYPPCFRTIHVADR